MSLFGKLKNMITGGGATVTLDVLSQPVRGEAFGVRVTVVVGDSDISTRKVYVRLVGEEEVQIPNVQVATQSNNETRVSNETVTRTTNTFDATWDAAPAQTLNAKQTYQWELGLEAPATALPVYHGQLARHDWKILAGIDVTGNDPDSGWVSLPMA